MRQFLLFRYARLPEFMKFFKLAHDFTKNLSFSVVMLNLAVGVVRLKDILAGPEIEEN